MPHSIQQQGALPLVDSRVFANAEVVLDKSPIPLGGFYVGDTDLNISSYQYPGHGQVSLLDMANTQEREPFGSEIPDPEPRG